MHVTKKGKLEAKDLYILERERETFHVKQNNINNYTILNFLKNKKYTLAPLLAAINCVEVHEVSKHMVIGI